MGTPTKDKTGTGCRIQVVDDDGDLRLLLERGIRDLGHDVAIAADAKSAVGEMEHRHFDIVVTDISISSVDGIELTDRIKSTWPETGIIMMGHAKEDTGPPKIHTLFSQKSSFHFTLPL